MARSETGHFVRDRVARCRYGAVGSKPALTAAGGLGQARSRSAREDLAAPRASRSRRRGRRREGSSADSPGTAQLGDAVIRKALNKCKTWATTNPHGQGFDAPFMCLSYGDVPSRHLEKTRRSCPRPSPDDALAPGIREQNCGRRRKNRQRVALCRRGRWRPRGFPQRSWTSRDGRTPAVRHAGRAVIGPCDGVFQRMRPPGTRRNDTRAAAAAAAGIGRACHGAAAARWLGKVEKGKHWAHLRIAPDPGPLSTGAGGLQRARRLERLRPGRSSVRKAADGHLVAFRSTATNTAGRAALDRRQGCGEVIERPVEYDRGDQRKVGSRCPLRAQARD